MKISFPRDSGVHDTIIEWWYYNGHLKDKKGNEYAFMNCLFRADARRVNIPFLKRTGFKYVYFSHYLVTDMKKFYSKIHPLVIVSKDSLKRERFFINYLYPGLGYVNNEIAEKKKGYRIKTNLFDLELESMKKPLLEGGNGYVQLYSKSTYYYSLTNLKTSGILTIDGKEIAVTGKSWMDHQWADTAYTNDKWTWFSFQFSDNTEMVVFEFDSGKVKDYLASFCGPGRFHEKEVIIEPLDDYFESKVTGAKYNLSYRIQVPKKGVDLIVKPIIREAEMVFQLINYWEGPITVSGKVRGKRVSGKGFMELVGVRMTKSAISQYEVKLKKVFSDQMNFAKETATHLLTKLHK